MVKTCPNRIAEAVIVMTCADQTPKTEIVETETKTSVGLYDAEVQQ